MKNLRSKIKKGAKRIIASFLLITTVMWSFGASLTMLTSVVKAAITVDAQPTEMIVSGQTMKASSANMAIARFSLTQDAGETLSSVTITIADAGATGVASADITSLKVFKDEGDGLFGAGDLEAGSQTTVNIGSPTTITTGANNTIGTATTFFITLATSASWSDVDPADAIAISVAADGIVTSANSPTVTALTGVNSITADTTAPTVVVVNQVNPSAVEVTFSEAMSAATAITKTNYTFSALTVVDVVTQMPNVYRVIASGDITPGTTTLTIGAGVLDMAGNANSTTTAQAVSFPVEIKISEVSAEMGSASAEFVELYNFSGAPGGTDISGWLVQYSAATPVSWSTIATIPALTTINPFSFYLLSTTEFDSASAVDGNANFTAGLNLAGGHIRLMNGATEIDKLGWGTAVSPEGTAKAVHIAGQSFERKAFGGSLAIDMAAGGMDAGMGNGWDTGNNSFDFVVQTTPNPQNSSSAIEQPDFTDYDGAAAGGPMINHMPVNSAATGADLDIIAQMGDPMTPIDQIVAELHYMIGDGTPAAAVATDFTTILGVHQSNGFFKFIVPQAAIDHANTATNGLYYYLKVVTDGGTRFMSTSPTIDMASVGSGLTYADYVAQEADIVKNPFIVNVAAAGTTYAISGTVTSDGTTPIESVLVFAEGTGYSANTNSSGVYTLSVPNGIYNIVMIKTGFYEEWISNIFINGAASTGNNRTLNLGTGGGMTGDTTKPMVMWSGPPDGMFGVPSGDANFKIFIGFSKDLDAATFISGNVYLTTDGSQPGTPLSAGIIYDNVPGDNVNMPMDPYLGIVSAPAGGFAANTTYYLIMNGSVRDTAGNALQGNRPEGGHMISFTAGGTFTEDMMLTSDFGVGAMMPPFVMGVMPNDGAMNVVTNAKININFSDPMDSVSVNSTNIKLYKITVSGTSEVKDPVNLSTVALDTSGKIATLTPAIALTAGKYRVVATGALKSATGIWMGDPGQGQNVSTYEFYRSSFEVGTSSDSTPPTILGSWPTNGETGVSVNPGMLTVQFSEGMAPGTINSSTITLKRGTSAVTGNVGYDPMSQSASFSPTVVLATSTDYTLTVTTGVTDAVGNVLAANSVTIFTTGAVGDTAKPSIMFANGDEYGAAITFSEAMNSAKITDTANWGASILNPANYVIKQGPAATTDWASGAGVTTLDLSGAKFNYDAMSNTAMIDSLSGTAIGNDYYIDMSSGGATDLSGNLISAGAPNTFRMPINSSAMTNGMLGPMMGGGMGGPMGPDMGNMGMMKAGAFPMNAMAGQTTTYFVDIPTTKAIPIGGKIVLTFPVGFNVTSAAKDTFSPVNNDINEWNAGTVSFGNAAEDPQSGGANTDGVTVNISARTITITTAGAATQANDFLHMDIKGIINSSIPRGFETSGYSVDMKTMDASGNLLETITTMPFFINAGGSSTLTGNITGIEAGDVDGTTDTVTVFLGSPMTGPMEAAAAIADAGTGSYSFSGLVPGQYMIFTDPTITLDAHDYEGMPMPQPITIAAGANTKNIALTKAGTGAVTAVTVNITGIPLNDEIDVFAGSPTGFRVKTLTGTGVGDTLSPVLYLPAGNWMVGVGPAMPKGPMAGPPPMPDWMPPMPTTIVSTGSGAQTLAISISTADMMNIIGYVQDGVGNAIADAEAFAYQPMGTGMGAHGKTDTNGKFTLKVAAAGTYSVGVFKPGLPGVPDRTVKVVANTAAVDGNATADISVDGVLITAANKFIFKIQKSSTTISGKVTNGTDPVAYAPVWAYQTNGATGHADTTTDSAGNYILYVGNGTWTVQSYIPGYGDSAAQTVVVNNSSMTQNLAPATSAALFKTIEGTITINGVLQTFMPVRAVQYSDSAVYTGKEFSGQTDASGVYKISVPIGKYRVDTWTPQYGEVELLTDGISGSPANINVTGNVTGANITIASENLKNITLAFTNGAASQTAIVDIDGVLAGKPTGFHKTIKLSTLASGSSVSLATGSYMFQMNVPGVGFFTPTGPTANPITISAAGTVTFTLPVASGDDKTIFSIGGTITDSLASPISGAWVWMGNPTTGVHFGTTTAGDGAYSLSVKAGTYNMGVEMPGFIPQTPTEIAVAADALATNYTLTAANQFIAGKIYADANSNNSYDSGEEVANGWVWVEETTTKKIAGAPTALDGVFSIGVGDGTYTLRGAAEGYSETKYGSPITTNGSGSSGNNIKLTVDANWSSKLKSKPMTPASGGTMDDSLSTGTGVKLVVPPNALGSGTSSGNIKTNEVSSVSKTSSAQPLGSKGKEITAQDNSGQAITTLNDDIEIELNYYKEDVTEANVQDMAKLDLLTNSYWDASVGDWVPMSTTKKAYTKTLGTEQEWTAQSDFSVFVDDLEADPDAYGDYKIALQSTSSHLTIFGATIPADLIAPSAPAGLSQTSGSGTSVVLDWNDNSEADLLEYEVYRSTSTGVTAIDANQINTSQVATSTFTDSTTTAWTSYFYTITAVDDSGNESAIATEVQMCSNSSVSNGTVAVDCAITCSDGYSLSGNSCVVQGGGFVSSSAPASTTGQAAATPSAGGTISKVGSDGTSAKVELPAGALTSNATVTITPTAKASATAARPVPSDKNMVGNYAYNFTAVNASNAEVNTFAKALTITLTYTNEQAVGLAEETLKIYYWDEALSEWVVLADSAVNTTANTIMATTTHFTYFAILGTQAEEEASTAPLTTPASEIVDGDIIQCQSSANPFAVYIVKIVGNTKYIRHIVSLEIFNYYGHLKWENLKQVDSLGDYSLSGWVRYNTGANGTAGSTDKVYEINGDQTKHWINMTAEQFLTHGGSDPAIYSVNQGELNLYAAGPDVMSL